MLKKIGNRNILIINPFGIGDVLFSTPIIHTLRDSYRDATIAYLCNKRVEPILKANPNLNKIFIYEKDDWRLAWSQSKTKCIRNFLLFLKKLKNEHFDLAIDISLGKQYSFFLWLLGVRQRIGFNYKRKGSFLTDRINIAGYDEKPKVKYYSDLLKLIGLEIKSEKLELYIPDEYTKWAESFLEENNIKDDDIVIGIVSGSGASFGKDSHIRRWNKEKFSQLADRLIKEYKAKIILFANHQEENLIKEIISLMCNKPIEARTNLLEMAVLMRRCNLVICNEGGPLHMAVALGVKTVSIFGPIDERVYGPYPPSENHKVIKKDLPCRPCYKKFKMPQCLRNRECINSITTDEVFKAVEGFLK